MNKAKRARWCNPLEGVGTEEGGLQRGRSPLVYTYVYMYMYSICIYL